MHGSSVKPMMLFPDLSARMEVFKKNPRMSLLIQLGTS